MDLSSLSPADKVYARQIIERCMVDRIFFIEEILGVLDEYEETTPDPHNPDGEAVCTHYLRHDETPPDHWTLIQVGIEDWQYTVIKELDTGTNKLSIRSAVGVGKTALVSWLALHFLLFRDDVKVIVTSPSFNQLQDGIIPEVNKWIARLADWIKAQLDVTSERIVRKPDTANNFISFRTARKETPEALQGIHATHVLLLVDEASGVHEAVYEAGQGTMSTTGSIAVLISNPTRVTGLFYKTHRKLKNIWKCFKITSFDSSRVDPSFPKQIAATYGLNSQQYKVRVLGEFPEGNADSVIPRVWVEEAAQRKIITFEGETIVWGIDPGRGGDATGFCARQGHGIIELKELYDDNLMRIVGYVKKKWDDLAPHKRPSSIFVDVIGLGAGVADRLEELELPVIAVNVAEMASMQDRFVRMRPELWHEGRLFFERKKCFISSSIDEELVEKFTEELSETCYKPHSSGKTDVESKKDVKMRGLASPNLADSFLVTLAYDGAVMNGAVDTGGWGKELKYHNSSVV